MDAASEASSVASVMAALKKANPDLLSWLRGKFASEELEIYRFLTTLKGGRNNDRSADQLVLSDDPRDRASAMALIRSSRERDYKKDIAEAAEVAKQAPLSA